MIDDLEALLRRLDKAEGNYLELLQSYQSLIHEVEVLKEFIESHDLSESFRDYANCNRP